MAFLIIGISLGFGQVQKNFLPTKGGEPSTAISVLPSKGFSPQSAFLLMDINKLKKENKFIQKSDTLLIDKYSLFFINGEFWVNSFLVVSEEFDKSEFESKGGFINSTSQKILTASIPVNKLSEIVDLEGIQYVQIAEKAERNMDIARGMTWVNSVHQGYQLPQPFFGSGVVVGIIDKGFDYTHPNFYDGSGASNYRVKRVWEQDATTGTPPNGFNYGRELTTQSSILSVQRDVNNTSHGTHVAGIAAGAGGGVNTTYLGVASQSDLVFVSTKMTTVSIADGIQYIVNYANSVNKPCVINMSLGIHVGPHDGLSAFDVYCDGIVGNGKILVGAAGNEGEDPIHISKSHTSSDNNLYTFVQFPLSSNGTNGVAGIDIWGNPNQNFEVAVYLFNTNSVIIEASTPNIQANSNSTYNFTLYDDDFFIPDPCYVQISATQSPLNNKRNVQIIIDNTAQDDSYRWAMVAISATSGQTKMWAFSKGTQFTNYGYASPVLNGSTNSTVGEIGGTGKSIIAVGAYNSTAPNLGNIASFSSKGPTADGRKKPDITAPGNRITSSVSRFDNNYLSGGSYWSDVVSGVTNGTHSWYFGRMQGTSMASPMVAGIIALWLQAYPNLNPTQALNIIKQNAITDSFTGNISTSGNNTWGWGKVNAHEGLKNLLTKIPAQPFINPSGNVSFCQGQNAQLTAPSGFTSYLWSNNATAQSISVSNGGNYSVRVTNSQGYISPWSATKSVYVLANPPTPSITLNGNVLTSSSTTGNQWYLNGNAIVGATQQNYTAQLSGNYYVVVKNSNNCSKQSNTLPFTTIGIEESVDFGLGSIYPNPTNGIVNIQFSDNQEDAKLEIFDLSGRLHLSKTIFTISQNSIETLNLDRLKSGVYTLKIVTNQNQSTFRIILTK